MRLEIVRKDPCKKNQDFERSPDGANTSWRDIHPVAATDPSCPSEQSAAIRSLLEIFQDSMTSSSEI